MSWFDEHSLIADLIVLLLPGLSIFSLWVIIGLDIFNAFIQAIITTILLYVMLMYLSYKNKTNILRFFNV